MSCSICITEGLSMSVTPLHLPQTLTEYLISEHKTLGKNSLIYTQGEKTKESNFLKRGLVGLYHIVCY